MTKSEEKHYQELLAALPGVVEVLAPFSEMAKHRTFPFHGQMQAMQANPNTSVEPGFQLFYRDFYRAAAALSTLRALLSGKEGV